MTVGALAPAILAAAIGVALPAGAAEPQDWQRADVAAGIASSFALPWGDLYVKRTPNEWRNALDGLTLTAAFVQPLSQSTKQGPVNRAGQPTLQATGGSTFQASASYRPLGNWFISGTAHVYLDQNRQATWDPDFTYRFGYEDWRPFTASLVYANYGGNRFDPDRAEGEKHTRFSRGTVSAGWRFPLPRSLAEPFLIETDKRIDCTVHAHWTPRYYDAAIDATRRHKHSASLGCRAPVWRGLYVEGAAFAYPDRGDKQPWDPDMTYGFGWSSGWPTTWTIAYANYSGNRFPGNNRGQGQGRFKDGALSISWSRAW